jgi:hypothetical protein
MPRPSGISVKAIGLLAAALLTLIFAIIIWVSISKTTPTTNSPADLFPSDPSEIPNIEDTQTGGEMFVTMVDKDDPTRVAATLKASRFEPIGEGQRRLDNPESWIYPKDGRAIKITADFATMLMPDPNQPPESGTLVGNILIQAFDSKDSINTPTLTARFEEPVEFERRYLRLRSPGAFTIASEEFDFSGADLTVILNELRNRIELIDVIQGDQITIHTKARQDGNGQQAMGNGQDTEKSSPAKQIASNPRTPSTSPAPSTPSASTPPTTSPQPIADLLTRYHITLADDVLAQALGSAQASADMLELWIALEDNALPEGAFKPIEFAQSISQPPAAKPSRTTKTADKPTDTKPTTKPASPTTNPTIKTSADDNDLVITWSGKMTLRPIIDDQLPPQFIDNNLALKLSAHPDKGIALSIPDREFVGQAFAATYLATQARLSLESKQTLPGLIKLEVQGIGTLNATALQADLDRAVITLDKRGQLTTTPTSPNTQTNTDSAASIQWNTGATLTLTKVNNQITDRLTRAEFAGSVIAKQAGNSVGARTLDARLNPDLPPASALKSITMTDAVLSSTSPTTNAKSLLTGSRIKIDFVPGDASNPLDPIRLEATGQALARNQESMLKSDQLIITLLRDLDDSIVVRTADAQGDIRYTGVDRTTAQGVALAADGLNETMTLLGTAAQPARVTQGGSRVTGAQININASTKAIEVPAAGSFDHDIALDDQQTDQTLGTSNPVIKGHIRATWEGSMRFDDALGLIVCEREVRVVSTPDAYTRDTLTAHRAQINLTPMPTSDPIAGTSHSTKERQLLGARITGYAPFNQDPIPAKIESRTYDQNDPERVISLIYLEGSEILADNQSQTLAVPVPGTLLILDRAESQPQSQSDTPNDQPESSQSPSAPGLTRFTWQGDMQLDRAQGDATFTDRVIVRQKTIATGATAQLETDSLVAKFEIGTQTENQTEDQSENQSDDQNPTQSTRLLSADASGAVRFLFADKELLADSAIYNALDDSLFASALGNKLVTLYDESQPAPLSARTMKWDLGIDRIEINAPTPSRAPTSTP